MKLQQIAILGAVGLGAYLFFTRSAHAQTAAGPVATARVLTGGDTANTPRKPDYFTGLLAGLQSYLTNPAPGMPVLAAPSAVDGVAANVPPGYLPDTSSSWASDWEGRGLF